MLSEKISTQISLIAYATVADLFATFHNPKMRGPNFSWDTFPQMMEGMVATQVFMGIPIKNKQKETEAQELGKMLGRQIAQKLVNRMQE